MGHSTKAKDPASDSRKMLAVKMPHKLKRTIEAIALLRNVTNYEVIELALRDRYPDFFKGYHHEP